MNILFLHVFQLTHSITALTQGFHCTMHTTFTTCSAICLSLIIDLISTFNLCVVDVIKYRMFVITLISALSLKHRTNVLQLVRGIIYLLL